MERKALDLLNQLWVAKKLSESLDTRVVDFRKVNCSRRIEEYDVSVEVDQSSKGMNQFVLLDDVVTRLSTDV